jgi:hypothetical protein
MNPHNRVWGGVVGGAKVDSIWEQVGVLVGVGRLGWEVGVGRCGRSVWEVWEVGGSEGGWVGRLVWGANSPVSTLTSTRPRPDTSHTPPPAGNRVISAIPSDDEPVGAGARCCCCCCADQSTRDGSPYIHDPHTYMTQAQAQAQAQVQAKADRHTHTDRHTHAQRAYMWIAKPVLDAALPLPHIVKRERTQSTCVQG